MTYSLRIYDDAVQLVRLCTPLADRIRRRNKSLAVQLDKCAPSVPLNIAEADWRSGGHARERLETAMGSAREVKAVLDVGVAARLLNERDVAEAWRLADKLCASLWKMTRRVA